MIYQSTRSGFTASAAEAVLEGLAPDGGLFVCPDIGSLGFDWKACLKEDYRHQAARILSALLPGLGDSYDIIEDSYRGRFGNDEIAPTVRVGESFITELFHGPTSAFKDIALSILPRLIVRGKEALGDSRETVILTATSGDTGKAAIEGFSGVPGTKIIVFYPSDGVSPVQKAQMVTSEGNNVLVCAVRGNFDDCQTGVKRAFSAIPEDLLSGLGKQLSSANSINIGRLVPQIAYYFSSYSRLVKEGAVSTGEEIDFTVPTGNFGDILAGYYAKLLGLPIGTLVCASNSNSILTDFLNTGAYDTDRRFIRTSSPSMDILVSSNLERLLFHSCGNDTRYVASLMSSLSESGRYEVSSEVLNSIRGTFRGYFAGEEEVLRAIGDLWEKERFLCDPHTAVAWDCARQYREDTGSKRKMVVLSTASPFKFPGTVLKALGADCSGEETEMLLRLSDLAAESVPVNLRDLDKRPVLHSDIISPDSIKEYVISKLKNWES